MAGAALVLLATLARIDLAPPARVDAVGGAPSATSDPLSPSAAAELKALPAGTRIIDCAPGLHQYAGSVALAGGIGARAIGFFVLSDGHCVATPDATIIPGPPAPNVDASLTG